MAACRSCFKFLSTSAVMRLKANHHTTFSVAGFCPSSCLRPSCTGCNDCCKFVCFDSPTISGQTPATNLVIIPWYAIHELLYPVVPVMMNVWRDSESSNLVDCNPIRGIISKLEMQISKHLSNIRQGQSPVLHKSAHSQIVLNKPSQTRP